MDKNIENLGEFKRVKDGKRFWAVNVGTGGDSVKVLIPITDEVDRVEENAEIIAASESDPEKLKKEILYLEDQIAAARTVINTLLIMREEMKDLLFNIVDGNNYLLDDMVELSNFVDEAYEALREAEERGKGGHND